MDAFASTQRLVARLRERGIEAPISVQVGAHPTRVEEVGRLLAERTGMAPQEAQQAVERRELVASGSSFEDARTLGLELQRAGGRVELVHERSELFACPVGPVNVEAPVCEWVMIVGRQVYAAQGRPWDWGAIRPLTSQSHSEAIAKAIDARRAAWAEAGMREVGSELELLLGISATNPELEAKLAAAAPEQLDALTQVYADWLQDRGDPRGTVGAAVAQGRGSRAFLDLYARHERHLLGPLAGRLSPAALTWRGPVVLEAQLRLGGLGEEADTKELLATLLALPACATLRELGVPGSEVATHGLGPSLARARCRTSLRRVHVDGAHELVMHGEFPQLERLLLDNMSGSFGFEACATPALRELGLGLIMPERPLADSLAELDAPGLEQVVLAFAKVERSEVLYGGLVAQIEQALALPSFAGLRRLTLAAATLQPLGPELPRMLSRLPCRAHLTHIDLSRTLISASARREFVARAGELPGLSLPPVMVGGPR